ncbi:MAG: PEGA domain-containing protein [Spirochaetales bacterium]|nr:PEGA domain-containing protein [Spirochaetales bacterium]
MKNTVKKIFILCLVLSALTVPVFAQRTGNLSGSGTSSVPQNPTLTVNCNAANAIVEISSPYKNGNVVRGRTPFTTVLENGSYSVTVSAPGYVSQSQSINLSSSTTLNFNLEADKPGITVSCNVRNATVEISTPYKNGSIARGSAPFTALLDKGQYSVTVSAPGYVSQTKPVNLSSSTTLNFNLEAENYSLSVTSNVVNAKVQIKGSAINGTINGNTSFSTVLPPGTYDIKVNAPGYFALDKTVQLNGSQTVDFQLQPKTAKLNVVIPNDILNYTIPNPAGEVVVFDNGSQISGDMQLSPGQHTIRIVSGGLAAQQTINVKAGEIYSFELNFGFAVIKN